ncbi:MAG: DUF2807 domain-containing protein [Novosphingobium sp.]|nr:DUF2807 domain-containing protein [Novosphingobium sp.]
MIRKLFIVSASALLLAMICLAGAWAIGGKELVDSGGWTIDDKDSGPHITRDFTFDPNVPLVLSAPVNLEFTRGAKVSMTVSGRPAVIEALRWEGGRLTTGNNKTFSGKAVTLKITAPVMPKIELNGPGNIELNDLRQPLLEIEMSGAGNIEASGKVDKVTVEASGAGNVDLEALDATDADVDLAGFGNADINASGTVNASIAGAGNITLHRKPRLLHSNIAGFGNVEHSY